MIADINSVCTYCGVASDITGQVKKNKTLKIYTQNDGYVSQGKLYIKGTKGFNFLHSSERIRDTRVKKELFAYGKTAILQVKYTKNIKTGTLFTIFHHPKSKINYILRDESNELILTTRFKSLRVEIE